MATSVTSGIAAAGKMMMEVGEISEAFWRETPWGQAMRDELKNHPYPK